MGEEQLLAKLRFSDAGDDFGRDAGKFFPSGLVASEQERNERRPWGNDAQPKLPRQIVGKSRRATEIENPGRPPSPAHVWIKGYWRWDGKEWGWLGGHWEHAATGHTWIDGHWEAKAGKQHWIEGRWK